MEDFTAYLQSKNFTKRTQESHLLYVERFLQWYKKTGGEPINCTKKDILNYLEYLQNTKNLIKATRRNNLLSLNHYFTFLCKNQLINKSPTALIKMRGTKSLKLNKTFTPSQLDQIYDDYYTIFIKNFEDNHISNYNRLRNNLNTQRNYIILGFLIYQGVVTGELENIKLSDIDFLKASVKIKNRYNAERTLPLQASQIGALMHYIQNIRTQFFAFCNPSEQLFFVLSKNDENTTTLKSIFGSFTRQLRTLHPDLSKIQQFRTSRITQWIKTEGLRKAQYLAGHKTILGTEIYLTNDLEELTNDISKFNPF